MFPYAQVKKFIKIAKKKKQKNYNSFSLSQTICEKVTFGVFQLLQEIIEPSGTRHNFAIIT